MLSKIDYDTIASLRRSGKTLQEIGNSFSVTRERIRQILLKYEGMEKYNHVSILPIEKKYPPNHKRCYKCRKILKFEEFYKDKNGIRGYANKCINCVKKDIRKYGGKYSKEYLKGGKYYKKVKARIALNYAVKNGKIKKGNCEFLAESCKGRIEGHHYKGYEKKHYFDIKWLCKKHHRIVDKLTFFGYS